MEDPIISDADRMDNGVVISFEDGRSAFYSAALLSEFYPKAKEVDTDEYATPPR